MDVFQQLDALEEQKQQLLDQAHKEAFARAAAAVEELNKLGFKYKLTYPGKAPTSKRKSGIRSKVLDAITQQPGISRQQLLDTLGAESEKDIQSVSNAIAALKRNGSISGENGTYYPASTT